ncbi:MAG: hypothetical protein ABI430_02105 [Candidatus Taylorbacteria bacterium]
MSKIRNSKNFKYALALFTVIVSFSIAQNALAVTQWTIVGSGSISEFTPPHGGAWEDIVFDSQNIPYVVYYDTGKSYLKKWNGSSWTLVGSADINGGVGALYSRLALSPSGVPYVAFRDQHCPTQGQFGISVKKFDGVNWVYEGTACLSQWYLQSEPSIAIDSTGLVYIAYSDLVDASNYKTVVRKWNGSAWLYVGGASPFTAPFTISVDSAFKIAIKINSSNVPYLAYEDTGVGGGNRAVVKKLNGLNWEYVPIGSTGISGFGVQAQKILALDSTGILPYVGYSDLPAPYSGKATVYKYNGATWNLIGTRGFSDGVASSVNIATDSLGTPYIAYADSTTIPADKIVVKKWSGSSWDTVGTSGFSVGAVTFIALAIDHNDTPFVIFNDAGINSNHPPIVYKFAEPKITSYSGSFTETGADDGIVSGSRIATLTNDLFTHAGSTLTLNTDYSLSNAPAGLTPLMTVNGAGTTATLTFTGTASSHAVANSISNLGITFLNGAFTSTATASDVLNYTDSLGAVTFVDLMHVTTSPPTAITISSITFNGTITATGSGGDATESGFAYGTSADLSTVIATSTLGSQTGTASFLQNITGLQQNTTYYFRAYAINPSGTSYGSILSTATLAPSGSFLTTQAASSVTQTTATLNGVITDTGGEDATESGFAYGTSADLSTVIATSTLGAQIGTASFSENLTGLTPNTLYYFRAYAVNSTGTSTGAILSTTTIAVFAPTVTTQAVSSITQTTATGNGTITATGDVIPDVRGIVYGLTASYTSTTTESGDFSAGTFTAPITDLICDTTYHMAAYAGSTVGLSYGEDVMFATESCPVPPVVPPSSTGSGSSGGSSSRRTPIPLEFQKNYTTRVVRPPIIPTPPPNKLPVNDPLLDSNMNDTQTNPNDNNPGPFDSSVDNNVDNIDNTKNTSGNNGISTSGSNTSFVSIVSGLTSVVGRIIDDATSISKTIVNSKEATVVKALGLIVPFLAVVSSSLSFNSLAELLLQLRRFWGLLLIFFGIKKRITPWGTVYDSVTKQPLDPAIVSALDISGNVVAESITDLDGRYGFLLSPGKYTLKAQKTHCVFPSERMSGKGFDEIYGDLYFGGMIDISSGEIVKKNIPLDPVGFDWNEFAKHDKDLMIFHSKNERIFALVREILFGAGLVFTIVENIFNFSTLNLILSFAYIILCVMYMFGIRGRQYGTVIDSRTGQPLSYAIIKVYTPDKFAVIKSVVSDAYGRYYCLVPPGEFRVEIQKKNADGSYTVIMSKDVSTNKKGIIKESFRI